MTSLKDRMLAHWSPLQDDIVRAYAQLWEHPELPCMEYQAAAFLTQWLQREGFSVEQGAGGVPTAFVARKVLGPGPVIGVLAEYDALPGLGNGACCSRADQPSGPGHACGHNHIGPSNIGAAIAAAHAARACGMAGEIRVIGCPAEELLWGKVALLKKGVFDGCDILLNAHGDYQNGAISRPCQAIATGEFVFSGTSSHGGHTGKANALMVAEDALFALRELGKQYPDTPIKHVIRGHMHMAGIVPDDVRLYFSIRHVDVDQAITVYDAAIDLCKRVANEAGMRWLHLPIATSRGYLANDVLAGVLYDSMQQVGAPAWSDADLAWMSELSAQVAPDQPMVLDREVGLFTEGFDYFSQDDGEVSWRIPLGRINWAYPQQVPIHNWAWTALSGSTASAAGPIMGSQTLALAVLRLLETPALIDQAQAERKRRVAGQVLSEPRLGAWETLTTRPQTFWNSTWTEGEDSRLHSA